MPNVELNDLEWQQVIGCMLYAPGRECMPLINKIGQQIEMQRVGQDLKTAAQASGNSKELCHEQ